MIEKSLISEGCILNAEIKQSVIGIRSRIEKGQSLKTVM
jgi:ADP-glucose pyrophosphorylase